MISPIEIGTIHIRRSLASSICCELARPVDVVARREAGARLGILDLLLGLGDRRGQVAALDAELDRDVAAVVLAIDVGRARLVGLDRGQLLRAESRRPACRPAPGVSTGMRPMTSGSSRWPLGRRSTMSKSFSPSTICVNASPPMATCTTASTSATLIAVPGARVAVDLDLEVGLADDVEEPDVLDAPAPCSGC